MKKGFGLFTTILTIAATIVGLVYYNINAGTTSFSNLGKDPKIFGLLAGAIAALVIWLLAGSSKRKLLDVLPVAAPILTILAGLTLADSRINGIASILTFTNNAQSMADLRSAIIAIAAIIIAAVLGMLNAFFEVRKEA